MFHVPVGVVLPHVKESPSPSPLSFTHPPQESSTGKESKERREINHDDKENSLNQERKVDNHKGSNPDFGVVSVSAPVSASATATVSAPTVMGEQSQTFVLPIARSKSIIADLGY